MAGLTSLNEWLDKYLISYEVIDDFESILYAIDNKIFLVIEPKFIPFESVESTLESDSKEKGELKLFDDEDFKLILNQVDYDNIEKFKPDYFAFSFGEKWYYTSASKEEVELNLLRYFGKSKNFTEHSFDCYLGVHTGFELCNGSGLAEDWVKKAKFLGIKNFGICELNTLSGVLKFQMACDKEKIKPIIGETVTVKNSQKYAKENFKSERYELKLYVENEIGWQNLLNINSQINVFNEGYVDEEFLFSHSEGLTCVITSDKKLDAMFIHIMKTHFKNIYFQIDLVEYSSNEKDKEHLLNIQDYLKSFKKNLQPILLCDSYYLEQEDYEIKRLLNKIGKVGFKYQSKDQHFKTVEEMKSQMRGLNLDDEFMSLCFENLEAVCKNCQFKIDTDNFHLPRYVMTEDESKKYKDNEDLFWGLIQEGLDKKIVGKVDDEEIYYKRIEEEIKVLKQGDIVDYFLILADIINWCHRNDVLVGTGRGSSAGSLIAYLINIVELDPIKYDLLFERFLNEARIKAGEFVDIDSDFQSSRRDDVKKYMESRYGVDHVASIGTYGNFKHKGIIKDLGREMGIDYSETNFITSLINKKAEDGEFIDLFKESNHEHKLKAFINKHHKLINRITQIIWQPKTMSIHASATLIVPFEDDKGNKKNIYDWLPVKKVDGMLITEWEGKEVEEAGFLKEDILATLQLDKFRMILDLIKKNHGKEIDWTRDINVEEPEIYKTIWQTGFTEDVFQFTTDNLKNYCKFLKPDRFEELIAANALARPGAMMSNAHIDYAKIKRGEIQPEYDLLLEEVTKKTFGLYIYQEQIMEAFKVITNSTLEEADMFRKIITKLKSGVQNDENFNKYKKLFCESYIKKGSDESNAIYVWDKLVAFSKYGFNRSHAACYAYEAYVCSWFKYYYPLEFWVTSLTHSKEEALENKIFEIGKLGSIELRPPDINQSGKIYTYDSEKQHIYWSLNSIKFAGDISVDNLIEERETNGKFKSLEEFVERTKGKKVNKRIVVNLILCGCFDMIYGIENANERLAILEKYFKEILEEELPEEFKSEVVQKESYWQIKAKELCGYGFIDYEKIATSLKIKSTYYSVASLLETRNFGGEALICGNISVLQEKNSKNGKYAKIIIEDNGLQLQVIFWNEVYERYKELLSEGQIIAFNGIIKAPDKYCHSNSIQSMNSTKINFV